MKYFLYARKSSESEDRQVASIEDQIHELKKVASSSKVEISEIFSESQSAKEPGRAVFNEMVRRLLAKEADGILCWKIDRLARNPIDGGQISWLLQRGYIKAIQTHGRAYLPSDNVLMMQVEFGMANQFVRDLSVNVKRGLRNKAERGWLPSMAPIGYRSTPNRDKGFKEIEKDPERFPLVRRIFDLMLTGNYTAPQIWKMTHEWGLRTKQRRKIGGQLLSRSGIYALLTNPFYAGRFEYPLGSGNWIKGNHPSMITEGEFNQVQMLLGRKGKPAPKTHSFAFTGMMRCGSCGSAITAEQKIKRQKNGNVHEYIYYHCTKRKDENCIEKSIEVKNLERQVDELLESLTISDGFKDWAIRHLHEIRKSEAEGYGATLETQHREIEDIDQRLVRLTLTYTSPENLDASLLSAEELKSIRNDLLRRKSALEEALARGSEEQKEWLELSERTFNFACYARTWFKHGDKETKRAILACLGSNLLIKDQKLNVHLHPFFLSVLESNEKAEAELASVRTSENGSNKRQKGTSVPSCPTLLRG